MAIPINRYGNCSSELLGSGTRSCDLGSFGDAAGIVLFKRGFSMLTSVADFEVAWENGIMGFEILPYSGIYDFTQDTPEDEIATSSTGNQNIIRSGKPTYNLMYDNTALHKSLYQKRGNNRWDIGFLFETGILLATNQDQTQVSGFSGGLFNVSTMTLQQGSDPQMTNTSVQLRDANQFNMYHVFLTWEQLGVNLLEIDGVVNTQINYVVEPSADDEFSVSVVSNGNYDDSIGGLDEVASWALGGSQTVPKTITAVAQTTADVDGEEVIVYEFTLSAALASGDTVRPYLKNGSYRVAKDDNGRMYKGQAPLAEV